MSLTFVLYVGLVALSTKAPKLRLLTVSYDRWWVRVPQLTWFPWGILFFIIFFSFYNRFFSMAHLRIFIENHWQKTDSGTLAKIADKTNATILPRIAYENRWRSAWWNFTSIFIYSANIGQWPTRETCFIFVAIPLICIITSLLMRAAHWRYSPAFLLRD